MKLILILLYLTIYIDGTLWAQEENHVFHYPLNIGDVWEYLRSPGFLVTREVIGDTVLSNGKTFRILEEIAPGCILIIFLIRRELSYDNFTEIQNKSTESCPTCQP